MSAMRLVLAVDAGDLAETSIDPWSAVLAAIVLIVAWILSRITRKSTARVLARLEGISDEMRAFIARIAGYVMIFLGVGVALSLLGAAIQPLITVAIVFGVILALALRGIADNFASGIVLQTRRPIHIGDEVESLGYVGNVLDMDSRAVVIETFDGRTVHLPNSEVLGDPLINHSTKGARRSEVEVRVRSRDVEGTGERLIETVATVAGVLPEPKPAVFLTAIDPVRVTALVQFWHQPPDGLTVRTNVIRALAASGRQRTEMATIVAPQPAPPLTPSPWI
jgi:small conductance mechanosensitive channel